MDVEADPFAVFAGDVDFGFVGFGDGLGDGESDAVAAGFAGAGGVAAVKAFEDFVAFFVGYAGSGVVYANAFVISFCV